MQDRPLDEDTRVLEILERYFLDEEEGDAPDLDQLCSGDPRLRARVERLLASEHQAMRSALRPEEVPRTEHPRERLGEFRIIRELGRGGMGTVYLAEQESLGRLIALKVLEERALSDSNARIRFRREAEVAAALEHPNVVPVYGIGEEDGYAFIAMKLLSGPSLDDLARTRSPRVVARIGMEVARGLDAAHLHGVVHRDVKPANILLDGDVPTLVDFGLARSATDRSLTKVGHVPGTLPYMAPEQLSTDARELDPRIDVYALGATMYEMLAGKPPFDAEDTERLVRDILIKDPPALRLPSVHRDIETIILRALEKEPDRRFPTAAAMAEDLQRCLEGLPILSRRSGILSRSWKLARRHRKASAIVAGVALLAALLGALLVATEVRERRQLNRDLELARGHLERGYAQRAVALLEPRAAEPSANGRVLDELEAARGSLAIDRLLDAVVGRRITVSLADLTERERAVAGSRLIDPDPLERDPLGPGTPADTPHDAEPSPHSSEERRRAYLGLALADYYQADHPGAHKRLELAERYGACERVLAAIGELLDGGHVAELPPPSEDMLPDEHVLVAVAKRIAGRPWGEQEEELSRAQARDRFHERTVFAEAIFLASSGESREAGLLLKGLADRERMTNRLWNALAYVAVDMARPDAAREALDQIPESERTTNDVFLLLSAAWQDGLDGAGWSQLEELLAEHDDKADEPQIMRVRAQFAMHRKRDFEEATRLLEILAAPGPDKDFVHQELAAATLRSIEAGSLPRPERLVPLPPEDHVGHHALIERVTSDLEAFRNERARGMMYHLRAQSLAHVGEYEAALDDLRAGIAANAHYVENTLDFAFLVANLTRHPADPDERHANRVEGALYLAKLIRRVERNEVFLNPALLHGPRELLADLVR